MRVFTDAEKQQLQAKIKDEKERQRVLKEIAQIENEKEAKRKKGIISTALSYKYGYAGYYSLPDSSGTYFSCSPGEIMIIHLYSFPWYRVDALLFNHIAYHFTKKGRLSRIMKTIAWIWIVFVFAYLFWFFKTGPPNISATKGE